MYNKLSLLLLAMILFACSETKTAEEETASMEVEEPKMPSFEKLWATDTIFKVPESALYDASSEIIYVSNVNQNPWQKDENGFISKMNKNGQEIEVKWVGDLSAPKGMGIHNGTLYVTDIDELVAINIADASIAKKYPVEGAEKLNDIAIAADGTVFFTDSGTGKVHTFKDGLVELWTEGLEGPNGVFVEADRILVAAGDGTFRAYDINTKEEQLLGEGVSHGDGIVKTAAGDYVVSDWNGEVFLVQDEKVSSIFSSKEDGLQTADIGMIEGEDIVLVPNFFGNQVVAYQLK
ncbi:MAG: ATP/GTP-binding protein [Bacteroidota bacterium]